MWFERRRFGLGWQPIAWQGWLIFFLALASIIIASWRIEDVVVFVIALVAIISTLGLVSWYFSAERGR